MFLRMGSFRSKPVGRKNQPLNKESRYPVGDLLVREQKAYTRGVSVTQSGYTDAHAMLFLSLALSRCLFALQSELPLVVLVRFTLTLA